MEDYKLTTNEPSMTDYQRFIRDGFIRDDTNLVNAVFLFPKMCKVFGLSYIYWLEIEYLHRRSCNNGKIIEEDLEELSERNGNVPLAFFKRFDNKSL